MPLPALLPAAETATLPCRAFVPRLLHRARPFGEPAVVLSIGGLAACDGEASWGRCSMACRSDHSEIIRSVTAPHRRPDACIEGGLCQRETQDAWCAGDKKPAQVMSATSAALQRALPVPSCRQNVWTEVHTPADCTSDRITRRQWRPRVHASGVNPRTMSNFAASSPARDALIGAKSTVIDSRAFGSRIER